jgi:PAS domain S-box-containing protein
MTAVMSAVEARVPVQLDQPSPHPGETHGRTAATATLAVPVPRRRRNASGDRRRESAGLFRALSEHATDLVLILEAGGTIRYASPSHRRLLGYAPAQMEGHNAAEFVHPADLALVQERTVAAARKRDAVETVIFRIRHADGSWRTLEAIGANRLRDPAIRGWVVNSRDITERLELLTREQAARATAETAHRQLSEAQRVAHIGSFEWDVAANRVLWSDELYRIYGLAPQSFGATFDAFIAQVHPDDRALVRKTIGRAVAEGGDVPHAGAHRASRRRGAPPIELGRDGLRHAGPAPALAWHLPGRHGAAPA